MNLKKNLTNGRCSWEREKSPSKKRIFFLYEIFQISIKMKTLRMKNFSCDVQIVLHYIQDKVSGLKRYLSWNNGEPHGTKRSSSRHPYTKFAPCDSPWESFLFPSNTVNLQYFNAVISGFLRKRAARDTYYGSVWSIPHSLLWCRVEQQSLQYFWLLITPTG